MGQTNRSLLDLTGEVTEAPFKKAMIICPLIGILSMIIFANIPAINAYGEGTGLALGFFILILLLFISQAFSFESVSIIVVVGGFFLGFWTWEEFQASMGSSSFMQMLAMFILAAGANATPIGRRIAILTLKKLGRKPLTLVIGFAVATAFMSSFISNVASIILMGAIANSMLLTMGGKTGHLQIGPGLALDHPQYGIFRRYRPDQRLTGLQYLCDGVCILLYERSCRADL